jgi:methyltransferase-like protein/SAM-dependent methyltransferase
MLTEPTSYDQVPYRSVALPQTHPDRLAATARIFSLTAPDVASCRVLELGCASGGNLIPMAFNLPDSTFVGIDLSKRQVDEGKATIEALGLANVRIEHASILDIGRDWGTFDYMICHGVFSWVEPAVQDKILQVASENLASNGIAYISYNTYPGWHMREMVRDMMRYHVEQFDEPQEQVHQARALLAFLASASDASSAYGQLLSREVERLGRATDSYLYHEHLEQTNVPLYFHQFIERAERAGLLYLSEASVSEMLTSHFPASVAETLERVSPDILHLEQYMDFVRNREFRQTLLCRQGARPKRALTTDFMHGLLASSRAVAEDQPVDLTSGRKVVFSNGKQRADATLPATKAAFAALGEAWPQAIDVDELCALALERAAPFVAGNPVDEVRRATLGDLFGGVMYGMVRLHTLPPPCTNVVSDVPRAHPLAASQAERGNIVVNAHHENVQLEPVEVALLKLCDGERCVSEIVDLLMKQFLSGRIVLGEGKSPIAPEIARATLSDHVDRGIASLTRNALLVE